MTRYILLYKYMEGRGGEEGGIGGEREKRGEERERRGEG